MQDIGKIISTAVLGLTIACIVIGFLLGLLRGRNRSILRFLLVAGCAVGSFFLKDVIIDTIMGVKIEGQSLEELFIGMLGEEIPEFALVLVTSLIKVILGLVVFLVLFIGLQFVSWAIVFPILKIFVRKGLKKGVLFGGLVGILQGVLVAFVICAPITGAITQVDKISKLTIQGESVGEMAEIPDMSTYFESPIYKIYNGAGAWFFDAITTYKDQNGNDVTLGDTIQAADVLTSILGEIENIQTHLEELGKEHEKEMTEGDILREVAGSMSNIHVAINSTSDGGKHVITQLVEGVKEMIPDVGEGETGTSDKITQVLESFDINELKLDTGASALEGIAMYLDEKDDPTVEVPEGTAEDIVVGLADNSFVLDILGDEQVIDLDEAHDEIFRDAINNADIDQSAKDKIATLLGISLE